MGIVACSAKHDLPVVGVSGVGLLAPHDIHDLATSPAPNRGLFTLVDDGPSQPLPERNGGLFSRVLASLLLMPGA